MAKIKILCLSIWYPLSMSRYFEKALRHREDVDLKTVGPYTSNWIPWGGTGMTVPMKYAISPDIPLPFPPSIGQVNYDIVAPHIGDWVPDIVLCIDAGINWKYKPSQGMVIHIGTDPHVLDYDAPRSYSDKFFNMQLCYSKSGDIYLPYAYSKYDHYPVESVVGDALGFPKQEDEYKDTDAVLIGMPYPQRIQWVQALRDRGVSVIFENGPIFDEARALYNRGRIGMNWSSMDDLNARAFEIPAMKLYPIMNLVPDLYKFKFSDGCNVFTNMQGAIDAVMWAKENPDNAAELAEIAYHNVQGQTYDSRIEQILKECQFL